MKSIIYIATVLLIMVSLLVIKTHHRSITSHFNGATNTEAIESSDWYSKLKESITKEEYNITYIEEMKAYQSPNRAQSLRFIYAADGFTAKPRTTKIPLIDQINGTLKGADPVCMKEEKQYREIEDWQVKMNFAGYGRTAEFKGFKGKKFTVSQNRAFIEDQGLRIEYKNNEEGMRQNFIVKEKPDGEGLLKVRINVETYLTMRVNHAAIVFANTSSEEKMKYNSLKAWDAESKSLTAHFEKESNNYFAIVVNDDKAIYPVTIDPLSTTANWTAKGDQREAFFGYSVSTAGDVNGDGYSDIVIGAYSYDNGQTDEGRVYVYHGSSNGLSAIASWTAEIDQAYARFGYCVSTAGDVNGDGYSDMIIGAPRYSNGQANEGRVYVYHGSTGGLYAMPHWTAESNQVSAFFGNSVAPAGDVNGDGYSDIVIGANSYDNGQNDEGRAFVYHGSAGGLSTSPNWTAESDQASAFFGHSVSTAGDVNGDGYSDIIVGAYSYSNDQAYEGKAYIYHGSASGLSASANWTAESDQANAFYGYSVSTAGDVNGDGYSDIVIGALSYDYVLTDVGKAFVYHGSANGLSASANWTAQSNQTDAGFGRSVSTAGDVNGDGYSDVIVGAYGYSYNESGEGRVFVYHGSAIGLSVNENWTADGREAGAYFGHSVSTAGDVNGDGYSDIVIGAFLFNALQSDEGKVFVYHGSASGLSLSENWKAEGNQENAYYGYSVATAGDVNGDGYSDVIIGSWNYDNGQKDEGKVFVYHGSASGVSVSENWTAEGDQENARLGISASTAGDVNGDGYGDVIVGAYCYSNGQTNEGRVYVYYGSANGLSANPNWTVESDQEGALFGNSVSTAGDVNGDGYSDIIVGSWSYDNGQSGEGKVFVYHGSAGGLPTSANWTAESDQTGASMGYSVATAGDVNGDGYSDIITGAYLYSINQGTEGRAYVYYGSASGLATSANWTAASDQAGALFGYDVATAGDVNGDGYSDIAIGSIYYSNDQNQEGRVYVYHGSANGLSVNANWIAESDQADARFGSSVSTAGDVNSDGYSDLVIGAYNYDNGQTDEGRVYVYRGSAGGLSASADWTAECDKENAHFGQGISTAGDVNGDGYSDVIVGAYSYENGQIGEGRSYIYYGNNGGCLRGSPQQYQPASSTIIGPHGKTGVNGQIRFSTFAKSPFGRSDGKLVYQYVANGLPFGANVNLSGAQPNYTDLGTTIDGIQLNADVNGIPTNKNYRWRVRTKYSPVNNPYQVYSPWRYYTSYQPTSFGSFKPQDLPMPVEQRIGLVLQELMLVQNYPNPFNSVTTIEFKLAWNGKVTLKIFDLLGQEVATLVDDERAAGIVYKEVFDASRLASGLYFYRLQTAQNSMVKKLMLVK